MVHIIRNLGRHGVTADKLKEVAYDAKRQLNAPEKMEVLDEIFRVRKLEERFERDEVGMYIRGHFVASVALHDLLCW
jgi:hypothetical protein